MDALIKQGAEFGLTAFLLVMVLSFTGWALWRIGNRLVDATEKSLQRQADAADRTADAVTRISDLARSIHERSESIFESLSENNQRQQRQHVAMRHVIKAVCELTPPDKDKVKSHLEDAHSTLDG